MVTLKLDGVGVAYGRRTVLDSVTTPVLTGGEVVAVVGPNAAGKSSLFRRIAGLIGGAGQVTIAGESQVAGRRRPAACYLPQDTTVNAVLSVYESILLAFKQGGSWSVGDDELDRIDRVLRMLDIEDLAFRGLGELSGGQRQLVSIAQTLAREPDILLLDEPTSALDLQRQFEVLALARRLASERSMLILIAIHDLNQALRFADLVLVLAHSQLVACGRPREIITSDLLSEVYGVRGRVENSDGDALYVVVEGSTRASLRDGRACRHS